MDGSSASGGAGATEHDHEEMRTTEEFNGSLAGLIAGLLICLPVGIYYYFANKEEMWVCPACQEAVTIGANTCPHCGEDLSDH